TAGTRKQISKATCEPGIGSWCGVLPNRIAYRQRSAVGLHQVQTIAVHDVENVAEGRAACREIQRPAAERWAVRGIERNSASCRKSEWTRELGRKIFIKNTTLHRAVVQHHLPDN